MLKAKPVEDHFRLGLMFAIGSAATFGMSGPFAKALMTAGWTPTAAAAARLALGAVVMAIFATVTRPGWLREARRHLKTIVLYGIIPIAGAQLAFYNAVDHLPVAVALLLEFTAPVLVVGWLWISTRRRPTNRTLAGVGLAIAGIMLVLDIFGPGAQDTGAHFNLVGVIWGLSAAICAACYFLMSDTGAADHDAIDTEAQEPLHPITLAAGGLIVGAGAVALLGVTGVLPMTFTANPVVIAGFTTSWVVAVLMLSVFSTALAYTIGITGIALLRPGFASLVGLAEVMFAVLWAWLLVGEAITGMQAVGGAVVLAGLALARLGDRANPETAGITAVMMSDEDHIDDPTSSKCD